MAIEFYLPHSSFLIYAEETSYAAGGTPSASNQIGKIQNATLSMNNNHLKVRGLGLGRNVSNTVHGNFDLSLSAEFIIDDFNFFRYAVGTRDAAGAGTVGNPYEIKERENIGYTSGSEIPSLIFELGQEGDSNDYKYTLSGVCVNSATMTFNVGETAKGTVDMVGKTVVSGTSLTSFSALSLRPFVYHQGSLAVGSDAFSLMNFSLTVTQNLKTDHRDLGSRFIQQPTTGPRDYTFSMTLRKKFDDTASVLSATEAVALFFGGAAQTSPQTTGTFTANNMTFNLSEGTGSGLRIVAIQMESGYFNSVSEPIAVDGNTIEMTFEGHFHSGLTDGSDKTLISYYTQ